MFRLRGICGFLKIVTAILIASGVSQSVFASACSVQAQAIFLGTERARFDAVADPRTHAQCKSNWCWAGAGQIVLNFHGIPITQETIAYRLRMDYSDLPATSFELARALSGFIRDNLDDARYVHAEVSEKVGIDLPKELAAGRPVIALLRNPDRPLSHFVVVREGETLDGSQNFSKVLLADPWPESPGNYWLDYEEFMARVMNIVRVIPVQAQFVGR